MKLPIILAGVAALAVTAGCESIIGAGAKLGISRDTFADCSALVRAEIGNKEAPEQEQRLKDAGIMCLFTMVDDIVTVDPQPATPGEAGEAVPQNAEAAAAVD